MKTSLLPLALLALSLPGPALAYPASFDDDFDAIAPPPAPLYGGSSYGQPVYPPYGPLPRYRTVPRSSVALRRYPVASPYGYPAAPVYGYPGGPAYGYNPPLSYAVPPAPTPLGQGCPLNPGRALMGAAIGGLASAALLSRGQDRSWAVPVGAALGGLGGLATGC